MYDNVNVVNDVNGKVVKVNNGTSEEEYLVF